MKIFFALVTFLLVTSFFHTQTLASETDFAPSAQLLPQLESQTGYDIRTVALENVFKRYNSPLTNEARHYVYYADKYNIDWKLLPSIAGLESTFGKHMIDGTHNAYGWGSGRIYFESWEDGIGTISKSLRERYYARGADTVYKIAPIYAESKTWDVRVSFFMNQIEEEHTRLASQPFRIVF